MHIGERIERRAKTLGITPQEIAAKCGISDKAVYQWFSGSTKNIRPENLVTVARLLKTTESWLVFEEGPEERSQTGEPLPPGARAALDAWEALPSEEHKLAMISAMRELGRQITQQWVPGVTPDRRKAVR
jgi:transcriptional regulator with XRE-family HTH domain